MPTVYVFGGRTGATQPVDLVQHYLPWGFGTEDIVPWSDTYSFQSTCNQTDIWVPWFSVPDQDQFPGENTNFDPEIESRQGDVEGSLPVLPQALYGLMATKVQSGVDTAAPDYPNGPFTAIFLLGGINASGVVSNKFYRWVPSEPMLTGDENPMVEMPDMPTRRAYGKAIFIPGDELKLAVIGGYDNNGVPLNTVDVFTFDSLYSVGGGEWETFGGTLGEALVACAAGYNPGNTGEDWVLAFAGWTGSEYSYNMFSARLGSTGDQVLSESAVVAPRAYVGSAQAGAEALSNLRQENMLGPITYNRYYIIGGVDENGIESIVETVSLP